MAISTVKRLASDILGVGINKIRISPDGVKEAEGALTREDVRGLIEKGLVTKEKNKGRASTRKTQRRGAGSKKGKCRKKKEKWMQKVRAQRKFLKLLLEEEAVKENKVSLYGKVKSGIFRSKKAMLLYLKDNGFVSQDYELPKKEYKKKEPKPKPKKKAEEKVSKKNPQNTQKGDDK